MTVIIYLIPISLLLGAAALIGFVWTVRSGQYDDLEGERYRILEEDAGPSRTDDQDGKSSA